MNRHKSHGRKKHRKSEELPLKNIQIKYNSKFISDDELKRYHDIYVKLNKLQTNDDIVYYISEDELNNVVNDKMQIHIKQKSDVENQETIKMIDELLLELQKKDSTNIDIDALPQQNINYDINDNDEYDIFEITMNDNIETYIGLPEKYINSMTLMDKRFFGKVANHDLGDEKKAVFVIYSTDWSTKYTYPIYVIVHNKKFTIKKFITIYNILIKTIIN